MNRLKHSDPTRHQGMSGGALLIVALLLAAAAVAVTTGGCTIRDDSQQQQAAPPRRNVDIKVNVDVHRPPRRAPCPDGRCPVVPLKYRTARPKDWPTMNLPVSARTRNYNGGSCVCASIITLLKWQGRDGLAKKVREICSGGQSSPSLNDKLDRLGIRYAYTTSGDVSFLEWCIATRRGAGIRFYPMHFVNLVGLSKSEAVLLDNNRVDQYIRIPRGEFVRKWKGFGGWAVTPIYQPPPPLAYLAMYGAAPRKSAPTTPGCPCDNCSCSEADCRCAHDALAEVNRTRAARGLPAFILDKNLRAAALSAAKWRADHHCQGHTPNDFAHVPQGSRATAAGCAAWHGTGWGSCCTFERWQYAGAAWCRGRDGRRYMHLFVR